MEIFLNPTRIPYTTPDATRGLEGEVRAFSGELRVYDGNNWIAITEPNLLIDHELTELLDWMREKKVQEERENQLAERYPELGEAKEEYTSMLRGIQIAEKMLKANMVDE